MSDILTTLLDIAEQDPQFREWLVTAQPEDLGIQPGGYAILLSNLLLRDAHDERDLPDWDARFGHAIPWVDNRTQPIPWTPLNKPVAEIKLALITTAGVYCCDDTPFVTDEEGQGDPTYRVIPVDTPADALCVKHQQAIVQAGAGGETDHLLPLQVAHQLQSEGIIGGLAQNHYSFMGYLPDPRPLVEQTAPEVAKRLLAEQIDAVILTPV